jgi:hypothetical protein
VFPYRGLKIKTVAAEALGVAGVLVTAGHVDAVRIKNDPVGHVFDLEPDCGFTG